MPGPAHKRDTRYTDRPRAAPLVEHIVQDSLLAVLKDAGMAKFRRKPPFHQIIEIFAFQHSRSTKPLTAVKEKDRLMDRMAHFRSFRAVVVDGPRSLRRQVLIIDNKILVAPGCQIEYRPCNHSVGIQHEKTFS